MSNRKSNYPFINNVRFWSMVAIVAIHALYEWGDLAKDLGLTGLVQIFLLQSCKFASPAFFLISGFLLGDRLPESSPWAYFRRRWDRIGMPWLFWAVAYSLFFLLRFDLRDLALLPAVLWRLQNTLLYSIYWFVPNSLVSLAILLLFRRFLDNKIFGCVLFALSLFWGCNTYLGWLPVSHTAAIGAFVSYLWLGNWAYRHYGKITDFLHRLRLPWLYLAIGVTALAAIVETLVLIRRGSPANETTVRISNQIFAVLVTLLLVKCRELYPKWINVRNDTYGIYLIHPFTLIAAEIGISKTHRFFAGVPLINDSTVWSNPIVALAYWTIAFVLTYGSALAITKTLIHFRLGLLVGNPYQSADLKEMPKNRVTAELIAA